MKYGFLLVTSCSFLAMGMTIASAHNPKPPNVHDQNHFLCYDYDHSSGPLKQEPLKDQFMDKTQPPITTRNPDIFCNPVTKGGLKPERPDVHLLCYKVSVVSKRHKLTGSNQFGKFEGKVNRVKYICLPSKKTSKTPIAEGK